MPTKYQVRQPKYQVRQPKYQVNTELDKQNTNYANHNTKHANQKARTTNKTPILTTKYQVSQPKYSVLQSKYHVRQPKIYVVLSWDNFRRFGVLFAGLKIWWFSTKNDKYRRKPKSTICSNSKTAKWSYDIMMTSLMVILIIFTNPIFLPIDISRYFYQPDISTNRILHSCCQQCSSPPSVLKPQAVRWTFPSHS